MPRILRRHSLSSNNLDDENVNNLIAGNTKSTSCQEHNASLNTFISPFRNAFVFFLYTFISGAYEVEYAHGL